MLKPLILLHEAFLYKLLDKVKSSVATELMKEEYNPNDVHSDDEFKQFVDKFEFELGDQQQIWGNKVTINYPLTLPYSKSVVQINN